MQNLILTLLLGTFAITVKTQIPCPNVFKCGNTFIDPRDGFKYPTVQIGTQCWFQVNLQATKYVNGVAIPNVTNGTSWANLTTGAWCDYNDSAKYGVIYGHLYNWYAAMDSRSLCPMGWYVPTYNEWTILINFLGGTGVAGAAMKTKVWDGTNSSMFTALPGGFRNGHGGSFSSLSVGVWWSAIQSDASNACGCDLNYDRPIALLYKGYYKTDGYSVHCLKDY